MLYNSKEDKEKAEQRKNTDSYSQINSDSNSYGKTEINDRSVSNEHGISGETGKEENNTEIIEKWTKRFLSDKDILIVCSYSEYESEFQVFRSIEEVEHYIIETQNIENDLYIIENTDDNIQNYDMNIVNRLFKSYKFISVVNAVESGLIREKEGSYDEKNSVENENDNMNTTKEDEREQKSYYNDFDNTSLFLNEE